ncbi:hypothetical protein V8C44DRAFT_169967 [Trichoderma aethiopicum]
MHNARARDKTLRAQRECHQGAFNGRGNYPPMTGRASSSAEARWSTPVLCGRRVSLSVAARCHSHASTVDARCPLGRKSTEIDHTSALAQDMLELDQHHGSSTFLYGPSIREAAASRCQQLALPSSPEHAYPRYTRALAVRRIMSRERSSCLHSSTSAPTFVRV